jgi:hypothetical protein
VTIPSAAVTSDGDKIPEPHQLPLTRQWVEDYRRYGTDPKPQGVEDHSPPDLQELVGRAGGYVNITPAEWAEYDRAMVEWKRRLWAGVRR